LEIKGLQVSGSETFSFNSVQTTMFKALFEQVRAGFRKSAQHEKVSGMKPLHLLFWNILMFSNETWGFSDPMFTQKH